MTTLCNDSGTCVQCARCQSTQIYNISQVWFFLQNKWTEGSQLVKYFVYCIIIFVMHFLFYYRVSSYTEKQKVNDLEIGQSLWQRFLCPRSSSPSPQSLFCQHLHLNSKIAICPVIIQTNTYSSTSPQTNGSWPWSTHLLYKQCAFQKGWLSSLSHCEERV